jgi:glycosyltransferase involved in cell wall biosynthesis
VNEPIPVTVGILTFNSVEVLGAAVESVRGFAEVIVCDGGSSDGTCELALSLGCKLVGQDPSCLDSQGRLTDIAGVRDQVVSLAANDWVLFLDSDELATPGLVEEIGREVARENRAFGAYQVPRLFVLDGTVIHCSMIYPSFQQRLVHRDALLGYRGIVHDVPVLHSIERVGMLKEAQLAPQPQFRELWPKWRSYMRLEEIQKSKLTRVEWKADVLLPEFAMVRWLMYRYIKSLRSCSGQRLPARYEFGRLAYELGVVFYTGRRFLGIRRANLDRAWER